MLLKVAKINKKLLTLSKRCHFLSKQFQITKFCERPHNDKKFDKISHKIGMFFLNFSGKTAKNGKKWILY